MQNISISCPVTKQRKTYALSGMVVHKLLYKGNGHYTSYVKSCLSDTHQIYMDDAEVYYTWDLRILYGGCGTDYIVVSVYLYLMYVFIHLHLLCYLARLNFTNSFPHGSGYMKIIPM